MSRFQLSAAVRSATPLFVGLCGPSGCGKTFSALRLASGIQSVVGGELAVIDTEASRALHYADKFRFLHLPFGAPFSPDDYWEAIKQCIDAGAKTIVIDSMSHEHEGPGGVLEQHDDEVHRLAKAWKTSESNVQFPAWAEPKGKRRRLVNNILQVRINLVLCFRAKKKVKMPTKEERQNGQREPINLGWMPIAGEEYAYEMTALGVLPPGAKGVPDWTPLEPGSELVTKRPSQFEGVLKPGAQLSEEMGAAMARWAMGTSAPERTTRNEPSELCQTFLRRMQACPDSVELERIVSDVTEANDLTAAETALLEKALRKRRGQLPHPDPKPAEAP